METPRNPLDEVFEVRQVKVEDKQVNRIKILAKIAKVINSVTQYLVKSLFILSMMLLYLFPSPATKSMASAFVVVVVLEIFNYAFREYIVRRIKKITEEAIEKTIEEIDNRQPTVIEKMIGDELRKDKAKQDASQPWKN